MALLCSQVDGLALLPGGRSRTFSGFVLTPPLWVVGEALSLGLPFPRRGLLGQHRLLQPAAYFSTWRGAGSARFGNPHPVHHFPSLCPVWYWVTALSVPCLLICLVFCRGRRTQPGRGGVIPWRLLCPGRPQCARSPCLGPACSPATV